MGVIDLLFFRNGRIPEEEEELCLGGNRGQFGLSPCSRCSLLFFIANKLVSVVKEF